MEPVQGWREVGGRVREARAAARLNQAALAAKLGIDRTALVRVESGQRQVSAIELFRLADTLAVPPAYFLTQPRVSVLSRRAALTDGADEASRLAWRAGVALDAHVRDVEWLQKQGRLPVPIATVRPRPAADASDAAERAREARAALGLASGPLGPLADVCEQFGLFLFVIDQDVEGTSVLLDAGPPPVGAAVIGGRAPAGRRRWTAAHELGHHLLADEYHSDVGVAASRDEREKVVDAFAGELLLPAADVRRVFSAAATMTANDVRRAMVRVAGAYRVSWTAAVGRAQAAGALSAPVCDELRNDVPVRGELVRILGDEPLEDLSVGTTGAGWRQTVLECHADGLITASRAVELLHGVLSEDDLPDIPGDIPP